MQLGLDLERVEPWLIDQGLTLVPPLELKRLAGGRSNLTYLIRDAAGNGLVARRPPLGHVLATAHDVAREFRILSALQSSVVPTPEVFGLCTDEAVCDAPFYVMDMVDGVVLDSPESGESIPERVRLTARDSLVDALVALHDVDPDDVGLGELSKRTGYLDRQLRRWSGQLANNRTIDIPELVQVGDTLRDRMPDQREVRITHGDFRFGNCIVDPADGRVAAILDWELCTLGDPLADVGYLGVYWSEFGGEVFSTNDPTPAGGFGSFGDLVDRYALKSGRDLSEIDYYVAFSCWRLAVIRCGIYERRQGDPASELATLEASARRLAERAVELLRL